MMPLLQIIPRLPPLVDGVGEYALNLAGRLRDTYQWEANFLVGRPGWQGDDGLAGWKTTAIARRHADALLDSVRRLKAKTIVLHYVGYGYHRRGVPFWLVRGLEHWVHGGGVVITMFHELWSSGPPWSSVYYLKPFQYWLIRRLVRISRVCITSTNRMANQLDGAGAKCATILPIPSNVALKRLPRVRPDIKAPFRILVFGQEPTRVRALKLHQALLQALHSKGLIEKLILIGNCQAGVNQSADHHAARRLLPAEKIETKGWHLPEEVHREFLGADLMLSGTPASLACKATTIATALATGCVSVLPDQGDSSQLSHRTHFWGCSGTPNDINDFIRETNSGLLSHIATQGQAWYYTNADWPVITAKFHSLLNGDTHSRSPSALH